MRRGSANQKETFTDLDLYIQCARQGTALLDAFRERVANLRPAISRDCAELLELRLLSRNARYTRHYRQDSDFSDLDESYFASGALLAPFSDRSIEYLKATVGFRDVLPSDLGALCRINAGVLGICPTDYGFRSEQNWIAYRPRPELDDDGIVAVPPAPDRVPQLMSNLARFEEFPDAVGAALALIYFFEVHPFPDGNGRTGRILFTALMHRWEGLIYPCVLDELYFGFIREKFFEARKSASLSAIEHEVSNLFELVVSSLQRIAYIARLTEADLNTAIKLRPRGCDFALWEQFIQLVLSHERIWATGVEAALGIPESEAQSLIETLIDGGLLSKFICEGIDRVPDKAIVVSDSGDLYDHLEMDTVYEEHSSNHNGYSRGSSV